MITTEEIPSLGWIGGERLPSGVCHVIGPEGFREALDGPDYLYLFLIGWPGVSDCDEAHSKGWTSRL